MRNPDQSPDIDMQTNNGKKVGAALVVGGGIGGMQAALDLAEAGIKVYLVEKKPCIGGVMSQLDKTFPTNDCAMCTMAPRLVDVSRHKDIEIITLSDMVEVKGEPGNFSVTLKKSPRYINEEKCTGCGICASNCPVRYTMSILEGLEIPAIELAPVEHEKMDNIINEFRDKKDALMLILKSINAVYNYFPENILRYISRELNIPLSEIYRIVTFYNAFSLKPRGRHTIKICQGTACHVNGGQRILDRLQEILDIGPGDTTDDMCFTLETVYCLGACAQSPIAVIDKEYYGQIRPGKIASVLEDFK
jgi:NADH:ubiquinone oxidoreductase subunit E/NAD-dependent dihydropyrimidine dehydrogenase PreA subunit